MIVRAAWRPRARGVLTAVACATAVVVSTSAAQAPRATPLRAAPCAQPFQAPTPRLSWRGDAALATAEWRVVVGRPAVPLRLVVVALTPTAFRWSLDVQRVEGMLQPWSLARVGDSVRVAFNAGQFTDDGPWGWLVHDGRERQGPGIGPLGGAVVVSTDGQVTLLDASAIAARRGDSTIVEAFQSFPTLLDARGELPAALCLARDGVDPTHRDIRFAIAQREDGHVLLVLSRLDSALPFAERTPVGPTTREMAWALRALGARRALLLDGGLSAQLLVRHQSTVHRWPGLRAVPLGLVLVPR